MVTPDQIPDHRYSAFKGFEAEAEPSGEEKLLTEIRDILKAR